MNAERAALRREIDRKFFYLTGTVTIALFMLYADIPDIPLPQRIDIAELTGGLWVFMLIINIVLQLTGRHIDD